MLHRSSCPYPAVACATRAWVETIFYSYWVRAGLIGTYDAAARRLLGVPLDAFHRRPW